MVEISNIEWDGHVVGRVRAGGIRRKTQIIIFGRRGPVRAVWVNEEWVIANVTDSA